MAEPMAYAHLHVSPVEVASYATGHPLTVAVASVLAIAVLVLIWRTVRAAGRAVRRLLKSHQPDDVLTFVAAGLITGLQSQGMWRVFRDILHLAPALRVMMFAVFEIGMLTCALRARRSVKAGRSAGVDGGAVWSLASLSGVLSATDAWPSFGGVLVRLSAPYAAAFLWERGLSIERQRSGRSTIHWRITPERILVRLGVAEPTDRTATDVDVHRRLHRVAQAAKNRRDLHGVGASAWRQKRARRRLAIAVAQADEHAGLSTDPARADELLAHLGVLYGADELAELEPASPWQSAAPQPRVRLVHTGRPAPVIDWDRLDAELGDPFDDTPAVLARWLDDGGTDVPDPREPVPAAPPGPDPDQVRAAQLFAGEICDGEVPSVRAVKRRMKVGQKKADEVRAYLSVLAAK